MPKAALTLLPGECHGMVERIMRIAATDRIMIVTAAIVATTDAGTTVIMAGCPGSAVNAWAVRQVNG
jgi:phosphoheptose isomerase